MSSTQSLLYPILIIILTLDATQFEYQTDFTASCYSRIGGFSGAQIDYDSSTLTHTLFDGLAIAGDITIGGNDYFSLQINFNEPIDLQSAQLIWRPKDARASSTDSSSFIFTQISYYNLFTDTYDNLSISQSQWDPIVEDYVLFKADTNSLDLIFTDTVIFQLTFQNSSISEIHITLARIAGEYYTWSPTDSPTPSPSYDPTNNPTESPSEIPTKSPTNSPTVEPTPYPTPSPTFTVHNYATDRSNNGNVTYYEKYSTNIYPLSLRNETLLNFTVPEDKPYCLTCILVWADIDASIQVKGCGDYMPMCVIPNEFYNCDDGIWILQTSGRLVDWQQTYGRIEIWEVDANDIEYLQWTFEFQWNTSQCIWYNEVSGQNEECEYLPLTDSNENTAMFEFTMPKSYADNRDAPLIVVWYDLLSIPYSIRPTLDYQYHNLTLMDVGEGKNFGVEEVWSNFKPAIIAVGVLIGSVAAVMIIACLVAEKKKSRHEYMLKTYNLRTAYRQDIGNEILPKKHSRNKSKFRWKRHGPWFCIVLVARLLYMAVFTLTFFFMVFKSLNAKWFDVLSRYDEFAENRDDELNIISSNIEAYYQNETAKMEQEVEHRQTYCYAEYINQTSIEWNNGALAQYNNHSLQMHEKSQRVDLSTMNQTDSIFITGDTACDTNTENGAHILESDPIRKVFVFTNGTYKNTTYWPAENYNRDWDNFTKIENLLNTRCLTQAWCEGWTWIDPIITNTTVNNTNSTNVAHYYLLSSLSDPINSEQSGLCYTVSRGYDASAFDLSSIDALQNRTDILRDEYLDDYKSQVGTISDSLNGLWTALKSLGDDHEDDDTASYTVIVNNDPLADGYDIDIQLDEMIFTTSSQGSTSWTSSWYVMVTCPGCPDGNFTSPYLQEVYDYIFGLNKSNISDFVNGTNGALPANISNLVTINPAIIEYPNLPTIDFPLKFDIPMDWSYIIGIGAAMDMVLLIYRWYRTIGILARIVRGKDVEIALRYLAVKKDDKKLCEGRKLTDKLLSVLMWMHDKCYFLQYNLFKLCYWITVIFKLIVTAAIILILYIIADQMLTVEFINQMGTFNLMTTGIAAQRAVRNQVLSTTALSYNNYTINTIQEASSDFAQTKNEEAWEWNIKELERVDEWNAYFCNAWLSYQSTIRDVSTSGDLTYDTLLAPLFDDNSNTSFNPLIVYNATEYDVIVDVELPVIEYTDHDSSFWEILQIQIEWSFHIDNAAGYDSANDYISMVIESKLESTQNWIEHSENYQYSAASYSKLNDVQTINLHLNETRYLRFKFSNASKWSDAFEMNEIKIFGSAPQDKIVCDKVQFYFWSFDASKVKSEECPSITPVFGNMYRGFVRSWINDQLLDGHTPFILAIRNIALSPFFILFAAIQALIVVYLLGLIVEWFLIRFDLFRENVYSKVSLITTNWDEYDPDRHYVTSPESTDNDEEVDGDEEIGGTYHSPDGRKKKYEMTSRSNGYFSPLENDDLDGIELGVISPRLIQMEEAILRSAEKVKNKFRRLTGRNQGHQQLLSPNNTSSARNLAQMLFNEMQQKKSDEPLQVEMGHDVDPEIESNTDSGEDNENENNVTFNADRCKQQ